MLHSLNGGVNHSMIPASPVPAVVDLSLKKQDEQGWIAISFINWKKKTDGAVIRIHCNY